MAVCYGAFYPGTPTRAQKDGATAYPPCSGLSTQGVAVDVASLGSVEAATTNIPVEDALVPSASDEGEGEEVIEEVPTDLRMTSLPGHAVRLHEMEGRLQRLLAGVKLHLQIP